MKDWIIVALGGALGAMARHGLSLLAARVLGMGWPWGTLIINAIGSFVLGALMQGVMESAVSPEGRLLIGVGFCGAFTTFSTFSVEVVSLAQQGRFSAAGVYAALSLALSVFAAASGFAAARALLH